MQRRSFLSVLAGASAALGLARYAEPFALTPDAHHEWVEDKGDYVIIRVPDFKTFARETINKPAILLLGKEATAHDVKFKSYLNLHGKPGSVLRDFSVDASRATTETPRPTVRLKLEHAFLRGGFIKGGSSDNFLMYVEDGSKTSHFIDITAHAFSA